SKMNTTDFFQNSGASNKIDDQRIMMIKPLIPPQILTEELPLTPEISDTVISARMQTEAVVKREDDRLVVIIGPCSIHDPVAAMEYGTKIIFSLVFPAYCHFSH